MRDNWLSNRVFKSYDDIVDHCCDAWNKLVDQPWRIMSLRIARMDTGVLISGTWYQCSQTKSLPTPHGDWNFATSDWPSKSGRRGSKLINSGLTDRTASG
jgi:hypothetical protein